MRGEWKSADQIAEDLASKETDDLAGLIVALWEQVDELRGRLAKLEAEKSN